MTQPSLKDIAEEAGVSRSTVSRALKLSPLISRETTERIQKIADKLGYKTDPITSNLMKSFRNRGDGKSGTVIGWINEQKDKNYWYNVPFKKNYFKGAVEEANNLGIRIENIWLAEPGMKGSRIRQILLSRGIKGLIFATPRHDLETYEIDWSEFALTILSGRPENDLFPKVIPDHFTNLEILLNELQLLGYARIGLVLSNHLNWETEKKLFSRFLYYNYSTPKNNRIPPLIDRDHSKEDSKEQLIDWVKECKPDCIITYEKESFDWLNQAGIKVPDEIGLASFNVTEHTKAWSGIRTNQILAGAKSVQSVLSNLSRFKYGPSKHHVKTAIIGRWQLGSTVKQQKKSTASQNVKSVLDFRL